MILGLLLALAIHTDFEGGSIGRVEQVAPYHFRCGVRGEVDQDRRNRQASWYYFRLDGAAGREVTIDLTDLPGEYNYKPGNLAINAATRPWISYDRKVWTQLPDQSVQWQEAGPVLRMRFTPEHDSVWVAHVPPYTAEDLNRLLADVRRSTHAAIREIAPRIPLITITNPERPASQKKVIWMMARQHAWEAGTSWVTDGAVRFLLQDQAGPLRDRFVFQLFAMADPDGVARGGVRFNAQGYDINRNWDIADPRRMPEVAALRKAVLDWIDAGGRIDLFLSLHNTNSDYLEGPLSAAGPDYRDLIQRLSALLAKDTIFRGHARDWPPGEIAPGRMDACQALFHDRGVPTLLLEQNVQLGAGAEGYSRFGQQLIESLAAAAGGRTRSANLLPEPGRWTVWSPRDALRPRTATDGDLLSLASTGPAAFGKWQGMARVQAGRSYRFEVRYRPTAVRSENVSIPIILTWLSGKAMVQRDFVDAADSPGPWRIASRTLEAPKGATSLQAELGLRWTESGSVVYKDARLEEVEPLPHRIVRAVTTHIVPQTGATVESNMALMAKALDAAGAGKPDVVVFSETLVDRGVPGSPQETAQTIPGPAFDLLARKARQYSTYVATSLHERDGGLIYNTAILIDRQGRLAGKYRKTHLAMIEGESGITPGDDYRVFATDFGKVGLLVCWDHWFSEPARILRLKGAEVLLLPIAGDGAPQHWDVISRARAIDNGMYVISSSTVGGPSRIVDPAGNVAAEADGPFGIASAAIDLDQERRLRWLSVGPGDGEARSLYIRERRPDTYGPLTEGRQ